MNREKRLTVALVKLHAMGVNPKLIELSIRYGNSAEFVERLIDKLETDPNMLRNFSPRVVDMENRNDATDQDE